jgi:hypothetical protein
MCLTFGVANVNENDWLMECACAMPLVFQQATPLNRRAPSATIISWSYLGLHVIKRSLFLVQAHLFECCGCECQGSKSTRGTSGMAWTVKWCTLMTVCTLVSGRGAFEDSRLLFITLVTPLSITFMRGWTR